jgi:hypothetical protein
MSTEHKAQSGWYSFVHVSLQDYTKKRNVYRILMPRFVEDIMAVFVMT